MSNLCDIYPIKCDVTNIEFDGSYLILRDDDNETGIYLSEISAKIFELCNGENTPEDITNIIVSEYDVVYEECLNDIVDCLNEMLTNQIIEGFDYISNIKNA